MGIPLAITEIYVQTMSPYFVLMGYGLLRRFEGRLSVPLVIAPVCILGALMSVYSGWPDFIEGSAAFAGIYLALRRWGFKRALSASLSILIILAADQLWQLPVYLNGAPSYGNQPMGINATYALTTITTAGWASMAVPLVFYFLGREGYPIRPGKWEAAAYGLAVILTAHAAVTYPAFLAFTDIYRPHYLFLVWMGALLLAAHQAQRRVVIKSYKGL